MINFQEVAEAFEKIANTSGNIDKERLLVKYATLNGFKEIIKFIYNPYIRTGIGKKKFDSAYDVNLNVTIEDLLEYYSVSRTGTQDEANVAAAFVESQQTTEAYWLAEGFVTKDLQIGVAVTTLNKVYGKGFIPIVGIMRGMHASESLSGIYLATEKIDGNRRLIMTKETGIEIYTRSGRRDYGLTDIEEDAKALPKGYVYDTELAAIGEYEDNIALRQATASIANRRGKRTGVKALAFDMVKQEDYDAGISKMGALGRKALLAYVFNDTTSIQLMCDWFQSKYDPALSKLAGSIQSMRRIHAPAAFTPHIMVLPILGIVERYSDAMNLATPIWETGGEGIMLVEYRSPYEVRQAPRPTLLKIKANEEGSYLCVDMTEHKRGGMLGSILIEYYRAENDKCYYVNVGSGFADYLREEYWNDPSKIIGKTVEIEHFGESCNAGGNYSLNCPIFKRIVGESE